MSKFCANGHQLEDSWEVCPYCQKTGYAVATVPAAKTRLEGTAASQGASDAATVVGLKTVVIAEKRKPPVVGWLVAMNGDQKGEDFRIREGQNVLGTSPDADIVLKDGAASARHASIRYKDGKFFVTDLDSTNGTHLNDCEQPIARETLKDNDVIRIGDLAFKFKCL
jgi:FHA domain